MNEQFALQVALVFGAGIVFFLIKSRLNFQLLPKLPLTTAGPDPDVTVVIPARNEAANIGRAVDSFPGRPVLVVDDHSADKTAAVAAGAGAKVIPAPPLPEGWLGKPHACWIGAQQARSAWLLFADADTWYDRKMALSLMTYAESEGLDMVSVFPRQVRQSLIEEAILPYAFALYFCGVSARRVNGSRTEAMANGQCLLIRREAYFAIGGHEAVAGAIIEDAELAALANAKGLKTRVVRAGHLANVRMYDSFGAILRGFEKNSFRFLLANPLGGMQVVLASALLTSYLPVLALLGFFEQWQAMAVFAAAPLVLLAPWYGGVGVLLAPLAIYLFQLIALKGMFTVALGRRVEWKGRAV
ncbi:MAG: glycosyltransferase [Bryobacterales bacterium]|nr:glycosyltransferase [Bryobacterales bacterium]